MKSTFNKIKNQRGQSKWSSILKYMILICIAIGLNTNTCFAQSKNSEFSISVGGPFSSLDYSLKKGNINHKIGVDFGLRYAYYLNPNWSLGIGVDYQSFTSTAVLKQLKDSYGSIDSENEEFEFRYTAKQFREEQRASLITVPLTVQYETSGEARFYIAGGMEIGLPITAKYKSKASSLKTSGYYEQYDGELFGPKFAGFGDFGEVTSPERDLDLKMTYILTLETGVKQLLENGSSAYIGIYFNYGLNDMYDGKISADTPVIAYDKNVPSSFGYSSLFETKDASDLKVLSFGVKLRYAIGF